MQDVRAIEEAVAASSAYISQLQSFVAKLEREEDRLSTELHLLRHQKSLQSVKTSVSDTPEHNWAAACAVPKPLKRLHGSVVDCRSNIRPYMSFFSDATFLPPPASTKKTGRPSKQDELFEMRRRELLRDEPTPNEDTMELRTHASSAFLAIPSATFTQKEKEVVQNYGLAEMEKNDGNPDIPVAKWRELLSSTKKLNARSAFECKIYWEVHGNPHLRREKWTKEEDEALQQMASGIEGSELVNHWRDIAARMPIEGRSPVQCLIRYQTKLHPPSTSSSFTPEENKKILDAVSVHGEKWAMIANMLENRTPENVRANWFNTLSPDIRQGHCSIIEDRRLLLAIAAYYKSCSCASCTATPFSREHIDWKWIGNHVPGRGQPFMKERFDHSLCPETSFRKWTDEEDRKLLESVERIGLETTYVWSKVAKEIPNRSGSQIAKRWRELRPKQNKKRKRQNEQQKEQKKQKKSRATVDEDIDEVEATLHTPDEVEFHTPPDEAKPIKLDRKF